MKARLILSLKKMSTIFFNSSKTIKNSFYAQLKQYPEWRSLLKKTPWYMTLRSLDNHEKKNNYQLQIEENAVFIQAPTQSAPKSNPAWIETLQFIKSKRSFPPLQGVILTLELPNLLLQSEEILEAQRKNLHNLLQDIHMNLGIQVPLYIVFTKLDMIAGFREFFAHLPTEEQTQAWGIAFPASNEYDFDRLYNEWLQPLYQRLIKRLDIEKLEQNEDKRALLFYFPEQLKLFKNIIGSFIPEFPDSQMRGIYFSSASQGEKVHDFVMGKTIQTYKTEKKSLFLKKLLADTIIPESSWINYGQAAQKFKHHCYRLSYSISFMLIVISSLGLYGSYVQNKNNISAIQHYAHDYKADNKLTLISTLSNLDVLRKIQNVYSANNSWLMNLQLAEPFRIRRTINFLWEKNFNKLFVTRASLHLEQFLRQNNNDNSPALLYEALKSYLALGRLPHTRLEWIKPPLKIEPRLEPYLDLLSAKYVIPPVLDAELIEEVRNRLQKIPPIELAYYELKQSAENTLPRIDIATLIGPRFEHIFQPINNAAVISSFYTPTGFKYFKNHQEKKFAQQLNDIRRVLGINEKNHPKINKIDLESPYRQDYINHWNTLFNQLKIINITDFNQAIKILNDLTAAPNPLHQLFEIRSKNNDIPFKEITTQLIALRDYLKQLQNAPESMAAQFDAARNYLQDEDSPMKQLIILAEQTPVPLNIWLIQIAEDSVGLLLQGAKNHIKAEWKASVYPYYAENIKHFFPFRSKNDHSVSLDHFRAFFGKDGIFAHFIENYIQPFVNTHLTPWQFYRTGNHSLDIPLDILYMFELAAEIPTHLKFSIQPRQLSPTASNIRLKIGDQELLYRHGPLESLSFEWPLPGNRHQISVSITDFSGKTHSRSFSDPWAWFKLLKSAHIRSANIPGQYILTIKQGEFEASFDLITNNKYFDIFGSILLDSDL